MLDDIDPPKKDLFTDVKQIHDMMKQEAGGPKPMTLCKNSCLFVK